MLEKKQTKKKFQKIQSGYCRIYGDDIIGKNDGQSMNMLFFHSPFTFGPKHLVTFNDMAVFMVQQPQCNGVPATVDKNDHASGSDQRKLKPIFLPTRFTGLRHHKRGARVVAGGEITTEDRHSGFSHHNIAAGHDGNEGLDHKGHGLCPVVVFGQILLQPTVFFVLFLFFADFFMAMAQATHEQGQKFVEEHEGHAKKGNQHFEPPFVFKRYQTPRQAFGSCHINV